MRKVLFITLSNIGDAVLTTPALETLHQCFPKASIDLMADQRSSLLFTHCPYRGRILHKHKKAGWRKLMGLIHQLRRTSYDLVVDLRTDGLAYLLRARKRLTKRGVRPVGPHAVEHHMAVVAPLHPPLAPIPPCRIWLQAEQMQFAKTQLSPLPGRRWLALGPGANWAPKIWPAPAFTALVNEVKHDFDGVVLVGGPQDRERSQAVGASLPLPCVDLCGCTDLLQVAAILQQVSVFVGNDSGLGHLAAAVGTPTLTLFGPGQPERYHPWGNHSAYVLAPNRQLDQLSAATVAHRLRQLLDRAQ
ncbi:glycosyl transferase family 9 [Nitrosococcus halophilus Nc 4]|uniref:Glycosyl transferase family 9 n=1 Tax=Nitrosococcus halophilus (strain Nc4) TaxID=472759 RepID=D5C0U4_NITHN|nr:glycosyltransferase family 9 protein [Nitrosococcus halophilus]ADE16417.1 glycosyl transferase family 9 [Nitrosococcus halophilus Nc 4]